MIFLLSVKILLKYSIIVKPNIFGGEYQVNLLKRKEDVIRLIDEKGLLQSVETAVEMNKNGDFGIPVPDYVEENVSTKVVKIIQSYTGVVNKMVWRKF